MGFMVLGKMGLVLEIVVQVESEVISVDFVFVYKGMDIGIVKFLIEECVGVVYYLIDIIDFVESYLVL